MITQQLIAHRNIALNVDIRWILGRRLRLTSNWLMVVVTAVYISSDFF